MDFDNATQEEIEQYLLNILDRELEAQGPGLFEALGKLTENEQCLS